MLHLGMQYKETYLSRRNYVIQYTYVMIKLYGLSHVFQLMVGHLCLQKHCYGMSQFIIYGNKTENLLFNCSVSLVAYSLGFGLLTIK